jgi:hypothetical protein
VEGQEYCFSLYAKSLNNAILTLNSYYHNDTNGTIKSKQFTLSDTYSRYEIVFIAPAGFDELYITVGSEGEIVLRDGFMLCSGNKAFDWTPAPEDAVPGVFNRRDGSGLKLWSGTAAQLPQDRDDNTLYFVE